MTLGLSIHQVTFSAWGSELCSAESRYMEQKHIGGEERQGEESVPARGSECSAWFPVPSAQWASFGLERGGLLERQSHEDGA